MTSNVEEYLEGMDGVNAIPLVETLKIVNLDSQNSFNFSTLRDYEDMESFTVENVKVNDDGNLQAEIRVMN